MVKELLYISAIVVAATVLLAVVLQHFDKPRMQEIKKIELNTGCEYLGRARDLGRVSFFDCKGVIEMRRTLE